MQYMISVIDDGSGDGTAEEMDATIAFNERMRVAGQLVFAGGLEPPDTATVIDNRGENMRVSAGSLIETGEPLAGFWVIDAANPEEALALATEASLRCNRRVELRAFRE